MNRKVEYSEYVRKNSDVWTLEVQGQALFHRFGVDCAEGQDCFGNFSTAIIELDDGSLKNVPVEQVKFLD